MKVIQTLSNRSLQKKISFTAVMFIALSFLLTGCGRTPEVNMILQNETGDFQYEGVPWGSDKTAVESALGITFDQSIGSSSSQTCFAKDDYTLMKQPAIVTCSFDGSGLYSISFRISPEQEDVQACWESLTAFLLAQYGSVEPASASLDVSQVNLQTDGYVWEHSGTIHTALSATKTSVSGNTPFIQLTVYIVPADREE